MPKTMKELVIRKRYGVEAAADAAICRLGSTELDRIIELAIAILDRDPANDAGRRSAMRKPSSARWPRWMSGDAE